MKTLLESRCTWHRAPTHTWYMYFLCTSKYEVFLDADRLNFIQTGNINFISFLLTPFLRPPFLPPSISLPLSPFPCCFFLSCSVSLLGSFFPSSWRSESTSTDKVQALLALAETGSFEEGKDGGYLQSFTVRFLGSTEVGQSKGTCNSCLPSSRMCIYTCSCICACLSDRNLSQNRSASCQGDHS